MRRDFQKEVIFSGRLSDCLSVIERVSGYGILFVAGRPAHNVERAVFGRFPRSNMPPVPIGVHMAGQYKIDAELFECLHKGMTDITDSAGVAGPGLIFIISKNILVHQDDFP